MQHLAAYYSGTAKLLHWLIAGFVVALLSVALTMTRIGDLQLKYELYQLHKSMGVTVLGLMILRLAWRLAAKPRRCRTWRPGSAARPGHACAAHALLLAMPAHGLGDGVGGAAAVQRPDAHL